MLNGCCWKSMNSSPWSLSELRTFPPCPTTCNRCGAGKGRSLPVSCTMNSAGCWWPQKWTSPGCAAGYGAEDADSRVRWERILGALDSGVDLKRRVVEQLRPTLLDNMGLYAALRWQLQESCGRAGLKCDEYMPEHELAISSAAAIAIFRVAQEAMTNIIKHARATAVELRVVVRNEELIVTIRDNGIGVEVPASGPWARTGSSACVIGCRRWAVPGQYPRESMAQVLKLRCACRWEGFGSPTPECPCISRLSWRQRRRSRAALPGAGQIRALYPGNSEHRALWLHADIAVARSW